MIVLAVLLPAVLLGVLVGMERFEHLVLSPRPAPAPDAEGAAVEATEPAAAG